MPEKVESEEHRDSLIRRARMRRMLFDPAMLLAATAIYVAMAAYIFPSETIERFLTPKTIALGIAALAILFMMSKYLGVFGDEQLNQYNAVRGSPEPLDPNLLREIRNYIVHAPQRGASPPTQVNIDEAFQGQLLARLTTESQSALASFIESEVFKKASEARFREEERSHIVRDTGQMIATYQLEMASWRKNANLNLLIGLVCAVVGIAVMWQTLVTLNFELDAGVSWKISDLYRFLARFGLVLIIESVAFFFLKLYREDRSMIRYLRNEITNLESKCLSLKAAVSFGSPTDISRVLQSLSSTERNFLVKKGERVMSDITYENSEILLEKLIGRHPDLIAKFTKPNT
jgi:multisubunit Na+/H+ antiporter MnhB subunit